ncbi:MAG: hypothetical protein JNJ57_20115, partial [Saprospiraceae bacterium]|nr:hypothetical protein [Saprospiraceae bacterium]
MNHLKFAFWLLFLTVLGLSQSLAQNSAPCNESFLKIIGAPDKSEAAYGVYDSKDGNLYMTTSTGDYDSITFMKMDLHGNIFWSRSRNYYFNVSDPSEKPSDLIVDNQGRIVCIGTLGDDRRGIMFKYDPIAQTQIWSSTLILSTHSHGLIQDTIDGNYTTYARQREPYSVFWPATHASIVKIINNSGAFVLLPLGSGIRYQSDSTISDHIRSMVLHNGVYYGCGAMPVENTSNARMRPVVFRMNLDYDVEWSWMGAIGIDSVQHIYSEDLFIENDEIIAVHTGDDGSANTDRSYVFLQKFSLDGQSIWLKKFDLGSEFPDALAKEVISVPDGFMIYGHRRGGSGLFFIKTDKSGNVLWARNLDTGGSFL